MRIDEPVEKPREYLNPKRGWGYSASVKVCQFYRGSHGHSLPLFEVFFTSDSRFSAADILPACPRKLALQRRRDEEHPRLAPTAELMQSSLAMEGYALIASLRCP
jgi:hypothetical protein